jgi:Holliday junction resolvasome RuvABC DNA-binding subunit
MPLKKLGMKMSEVVTKLIVDCSTGETREEILTAEEIAQREADAIAYAEAKAIQDAEAEAKATAKAEAIAALVALGLTEAQIAALTA